MTWLSMDTAPKNHEQRVLLFVPKTNKGIVIGRWQTRMVSHRQPVTGWWLEGFELCFKDPDYLPTAWQPLPPFPDEAPKPDVPPGVTH